ncbi:DUF5689 domain-containing protein [Flavobacteriaceae bacterium M23B6Z8]
MKNLAYLYKVYPFLCLLLVFTGCVKNDDFDSPKLCGEVNLESNATYDQIKRLYQREIIRIQEDLIIEGYVTSSDKTGNFFGTLHFQDKVLNPTEGFQIDVDLRDYHLQYQIGSKIYIQLNGLYLGKSKETYKLGGLFTNAGGTLSIGRLPSNLVGKHIIASCDPAVAMVPTALNIDQIDQNLINTLVSFEDVQIAPKDICKDFAEDGKSSKRTFEDCSGNRIDLMNSGFSDFQAEKMPTGKGVLTGVLGFDSGKYYLTIRDTTDLQMTEFRCDGSTFSCEPPLANATIKQLKEKRTDEPTVINEELVIEVSITATDDTGNFSKELYVQDETGAIKVNLNATKLFEKGFEKDRRLIIDCRGLVVYTEGDELQIGMLENANLQSIPEAHFYRHFYLLESKEPIDPLSIDIADISHDDVGKLVSLTSLQFTYPSGSLVKNNQHTILPLNDCAGNLVKLSTLKTASFGDLETPTTQGTINGILNIHDGYYALRIRDENDLAGLTADRCDLFQSAGLVSINSIRTLFESTTIRITDNVKIKGTVISSTAHGNFETNELVLQDEGAGITILFPLAHQIPLYEEVELALWNSILRKENGRLIIDNIERTHVLNEVQGTIPSPIVISLADTNNPDYESRLITLEEMQISTLPGAFTEQTVITNCDENILLETKTTASFYNLPFPEARGNITGIVSNSDTPRLRIRAVTDFETTQPLQLCYVNESQEVFISEIADPDNNADARFIELFNAGTIDVLLEGWKLVRYTNDNTTISSQIDLSGYRIKAGTTFLIAPHAAIFEEVYGFAPDFSASPNGAADSNGDDNLALLNSKNEIIDMFGVIGEDGSGTNHEFEDGRAYRKPFVVNGSSVYSFEEWDLYNDTGANGTMNRPQNAPEDFTPGIR